MSKRGVLTVISGFSGAGKGTLMKKLVEKYQYGLSVSATTRTPREGEVHGREYFFLSREEFEQMIDRKELIEWAEYVGNYYGTPKTYVEEQLAQGKDVILEIEIQGALQVRDIFPEASLVFVTPPTAKELRERLVSRGTEDIAAIDKRMNRAIEESKFMPQYDYIVINDKLEDCVEELHQLIEKEEQRQNSTNAPRETKDYKEFILKIQKELKELVTI